MFHVPNNFRIRTGHLGSDDSYKNNGAFLVLWNSKTFMTIASDDMGWEHVSVSLTNRCPNWDEMCFIKDHPPDNKYVNCHPYCLHLWKPTKLNIPCPETFLVGPK